MSKLIIFDFRCACGARFDEMVKPDTFTAPCPECDQQAQRIISPVRLDYAGMAMHDGMHSAIDHFDRVHRQQREIERRRMAEHGDYGPAPGA